MLHFTKLMTYLPPKMTNLLSSHGCAQILIPPRPTIPRERMCLQIRLQSIEFLPNIFNSPVNDIISAGAEVARTFLEVPDFE